MKVKLLGREWEARSWRSVVFGPSWRLISNGSQIVSDDYFPTEQAAREDLLAFLKEHGGKVLE